MRFRQNTVEFLSLCGALVFFALFFYQTTNNIYRISGAFVDFSLAGWAAMLALWGAGLWRYFKQQKAGVLIFAVQAAVVCYAFDCWRLFIYATNLAMKPYILGIVAAEAAVFLIAACGRYKPAALNALVAGIIIFFGYYIMYPILLPLPATMAIAVLLSLIYPAAMGTAKARKAAIGVLAAALIIPGGVLIDGWLNAPGIRFYERRIDKPTENVKVSVVVPVYNAEKYLERCLDSLRKQTLKDIEIICVNDGSTDGSGEILAEYAAHDKRFKVITQENQYIGAARNRGIEAARGEYVGFVDSDDWVSPNYFEDLYNAAKKYNTDVAIAEQAYAINSQPQWWRNLYGLDKAQNILRARENIGLLLQNKKTAAAIDICRIARGGYVWDKIFRRNFLNEHNLRFSLFRTASEDVYFFFVTGLYTGKMAVAGNAAYFYFQGGVSQTSRRHFSATMESIELFAALDRLYAESGVVAETLEPWEKCLDQYRLYDLAMYHNLFSDEDKAIWRERWQKYFPNDDIDKAIADEAKKSATTGK